MTKKGRVPDAYSGGFLSTIESTGAGSSGLTGQGSMNISNHRDSSTTSKKWMKLLSALRGLRALHKRLDLHSTHGVTISSSRIKPRGAKNKGTFSPVLRKQCKNLLKKLMLHRHGWVFNKPVDIIEFNIPDYYDVIKNPMDFGTIKEKLGSDKYSSPMDFLADVRLTFTNAMTYNPPGNHAHVKAVALRKVMHPSKKSKIKVMHPSKKSKITMAMIDEEKHNLSRDLEVHLENLPDQIIDFLKEHASNGNETGKDEIEVDIDDFDYDSLLKLRKMLDEHVQDKGNYTEVETSVISIVA
ncbi:unnamed protein product [Lactuca saligna]|uniref:Histone acetyltransferase n=1 Tax=Lactuca saligna TaxID=75948 RepID=A0AA35YF57_LACSI|nr:unnamed protein product [Lactuca saligna]